MKRVLLLTFILAGLWSNPTAAYSVLTHEAIIDSLWPDTITPLLMQRFPEATDADILGAHKYAYGGAIIQDMGYYPFGSKLFTDLVHYVRSADFIAALLEQSKDLNEYAFALGALAHYASDNTGFLQIKSQQTFAWRSIRHFIHRTSWLDNYLYMKSEVQNLEGSEGRDPTGETFLDLLCDHF